jgi:hypothetical protein
MKVNDVESTGRLWTETGKKVKGKAVPVTYHGGPQD